jgi:uncharacterized protein YndB with AHSA1/START domain
MPDMQFTTTIHAPPEQVFNLISDLPNYGKWLPPSSLYGSVTQYSDLPVREGTQYVDQGKTSRMTGAVTEFDPPKRITFKQTTVSVFGQLTIQICYTLESAGDGTRVLRETTIMPSGGFLLLQPAILGPIRRENERILEQMKTYLETKK